MDRIFIVNASPLICLARIKRLDLLGGLAEEIAVPVQVMNELDAGASHDDAARSLREPNQRVAAELASALVRRQDRAREALPATLLVHPPVIELQDVTVPSPNGARWASLRSVRRTSHFASRPFAR